MTRRFAPTLLCAVVCLSPGSGVATDSLPRSLQQARGHALCDAWQDCWRRAKTAIAEQEYERAHDLAWRAIQTGPPGHPLLIYDLARTQSLSGRPGDALVTLTRLADAGVPTDARSSEDFRSARRLDGWAAVEASVARAAAGVTRSTTIFDLREADLVPGAIVHDAVSRRFLVGSARKRKVVVFSEDTWRSTDLVRSDSAGFYGVSGMSIDVVRGDLWVASVGGGPAEGGNGSTAGVAALHRINLISGRPLATYRADPTRGPQRFGDVVVTPGGDVLVLDLEAGTIERLERGSDRLARFVSLGDGRTPLSAALGGAGEYAFVAHPEGVVRVDLRTRGVVPLGAVADVILVGIRSLHSHRRGLVAVQSLPGVDRIVRFTLDDSGTRVMGQEVLEANLPSLVPGTGTLVGDDFYYIATPSSDQARASGGAAEGSEATSPATVRRLPLG